MKSVATGTVVFAASSLFAVTTVALGGGNYYNLGVSPSPTAASNCENLVVAGTSGGQYFTWTVGGGLVLVGGDPIAGNSRISDDGTRFSGTLLNPASNLIEMAFHDVPGGTWTPLGGVGAPCGTELGSGWGISGDGSSVVGLGWLTCNPAHAIQWIGGVTMDLGSTVAGRSTRANGCDFDGSVVGGWQDSATGFRQGAIWVNGAQTLMTFAGTGAAAGEAQDLSDDGSVVVGSGVSANGFQAWRWTAATNCVSLGNIFTATWRGAATAITGDGDTVIGFYRPFPGPATFGEGFIWTAAGGMEKLTDYVIAQGVVLPAGTILALPLDISADGKTIVGLSRVGFAASGFVVTLPGRCTCPADLNGDGIVDGGDLGLLIGDWGAAGGPADLNGDGIVDGADLGLMIGAWGPC